MKISNRISNIICLLCLIAILLPEDSYGQRFGHGGGGGSRGGSAAGGSRSGGGFRGGAVNGGNRAPEAPRGGAINGGSRNFGTHVFGGVSHNPRPTVIVHGNENAYHHIGGGYHPYAYHPYHPYYWGPRWHPLGFFLGALTADAILLSLNNQNYYYDDGVYYTPSGNGYTAIAPPVGAVVSYLPAGFETVPLGDDTYFYYGGAFYVSQGGSYRVVPGPVGAVVTEIPEGATQQNINGQSYLLYNNTYYAPISSNGQDAYEVVDVN